jgi:site-specific DNA recombinase
VIEAINRLTDGREARAPQRFAKLDFAELGKGPGVTRSTSPAQLDANAGSNVAEERERIRSAIERVSLERKAIRIILSDPYEQSSGAASKVIVLSWTPPSPWRRREIIQGETVSASARPLRRSARLVLVEALRKAHRWLDELLVNRHLTIEAIALREARSERSIGMTLSLAFLAPDIVKAAIEGRLPRGFGLSRLIDLPVGWSDQWRALGLRAPPRS